MIDGLKLTMTGEEIRSLIEQRAAEHRTRATNWKREAARTPEDQTEDRLLMPERMCEHEAGQHEWRAEVLTFVRDHVDPSEIYQLGEWDLDFAELLPTRPEWLEQDEFDELAHRKHDLGPYARRICDSPEIVQVVNPDWTPGKQKGH